MHRPQTRGPYFYHKARKHFLIDGVGGVLVAQVPFVTEGDATSEGDAKLLAAAFDLADALRLLLDDPKKRADALMALDKAGCL